MDTLVGDPASASEVMRSYVQMLHEVGYLKSSSLPAQPQEDCDKHEDKLLAGSQRKKGFEVPAHASAGNLVGGMWARALKRRTVT